MNNFPYILLNFLQLWYAAIFLELENKMVSLFLLLCPCRLPCNVCESSKNISSLWPNNANCRSLSITLQMKDTRQQPILTSLVNQLHMLILRYQINHFSIDDIVCQQLRWLAYSRWWEISDQWSRSSWDKGVSWNLWLLLEFFKLKEVEFCRF